ADLFLFASETETQGLVLAEAAACGLPAVTVTAPGCDEVVHDGESGILTKSDPASLAGAAIRLPLDDERRAAMGARARQIAVREFGIELQITRILDIYTETLSRRAESASRRACGTPRAWAGASAPVRPRPGRVARRAAPARARPAGAHALPRASDLS